MKKTRILGLLFAVVLCIVGCGSSAEIKVDTLSISGNGAATYTIISDFSEPYYNLEELKSMAQKEVEAYGTGVQISSAEVTDGVLKFQYTFDSLSHYSRFMETSCYQGTVAAALANGYKADTKLTSAKGGSLTMSDSSIRERNLFIWNEEVAVRCDGSVVCYSENLSLSGKTDVQPKEGSVGPYYVVYK